MSLPVDDLEARALSLPPEDRARLLERLIASFEPKSPAQRPGCSLPSAGARMSVPAALCSSPAMKRLQGSRRASRDLLDSPRS